MASAFFLSDYCRKIAPPYGGVELSVTAHGCRTDPRTALAARSGHLPHEDKEFVMQQRSATSAPPRPAAISRRALLGMIGTAEWLEFCELAGIEPLLNVGFSTVR